jgi:hypothetical protein
VPQFKCLKSNCTGRINVGSTNCPVCGRYFGVFGQHGSPLLVNKYCEKEYQGQNPRDAKVIFIGRDANFAEDLAKVQFAYIFNILLGYLDNGVAFWENSDDPQYWRDNTIPRRRVHHPFLLPAYGQRDGYMYHHNFSRLGLDSGYAKFISFVEIVSVPTTGYPKNDLNDKLKSLTKDSKQHLANIESLILSGGKKVVFISDTAIHALGDLDQLSDFYQKIYDKRREPSRGIPPLHSIGSVTIHKCYHFSDPKARTSEHKDKLVKLIDNYCNLTS